MVTWGVMQELNRQGFVLLKPEPTRDIRASLLSLSEVFGTVIRHPLSDEHGIVRVMPDPGLRRFGDVFSDRDVALHTDGAFLDVPPRVVALQCEVAPDWGGANCLLDGRALHDHLRSVAPDGFAALFDDDAVTITRGSEAATRPMFSRQGRYTQVRFRLDEGVRVSFSPAVAPLIPLIRGFLRNPGNRSWLSLRPGEILIVDNGRMLHGRSGFSERPVRLMNRLWLDGRSTFDVACGFETTARTRTSQVRLNL